MRLWHKDLIPYLPRLQLISQWKECCCISKNIATNGTPNHILVNKVLDYPARHFLVYTYAVIQEMQKRGYKISPKSLQNFLSNMCKANKYFVVTEESKITDIFTTWHTPRYFKQCFYNLQEKYDCGSIPQEEWEVLWRVVHENLSYIH